MAKLEAQQHHSKDGKGDEEEGSPPAFIPPPPPLPPPLPHKFLILDCSAMNFLDYVGVTGDLTSMMMVNLLVAVQVLFGSSIDLLID